MVNGTPESHVWEIYGAEGNGAGALLLNKVTGELRAMTMSGNSVRLLKTIDKN